jgi:antitoxin component YwqK of YwqJK toxin-antitoxin module
VSGMFFENGNLHHVNIGMRGFYKHIISYHDNGYVYGMFYFDENDLDHGWHFWFDESGNLKQKILYEHGQEISNEVIQPEK